MRARISWRNWADGATLSASSATVGTPVSNLQVEHPKVPWRAPAGTAEAFLVADLDEPRPIGLVALNNVDLADATWRVRVSTSDPAGEAALVYDSGTVAAAVDPRYPKLLHFLPAEVTGRYVRLDLAIPDPNSDVFSTLGVGEDELGVGDDSLGFVVTIADPERRIGAGRLWIGPVVELSRSYAPGWKPLVAAHSERFRSGGGQSWVTVRPGTRGARLTFRAITEAEALGVIEDINAEAGTAADVILCRDPASPALGRDTYWGLLTVPVDNQHWVTKFYTAVFDIWDRR